MFFVEFDPTLNKDYLILSYLNVANGLTSDKPLCKSTMIQFTDIGILLFNVE